MQEGFFMPIKQVFRTLYLAPASGVISASSTALGLIRAYQREGFEVGFAKPVSDAGLDSSRPDRSVHFARTLCGLSTPDPIPAKHAEDMIRAGDEASLMEEIVALVESARGSCSMVIVEGITPSHDHPLMTDLDRAIARNLGAEVLVLVQGRNTSVRNVVETITDASYRYGSEGGRPLAGAIAVRVPKASSYREDIAQGLAESGLKTPLVCISPDNPEKLAKFTERDDLPFTLLSDSDKAVLTAYGAFGEKKLYGKVVTGVIRSTFVIAADGTIEHAFYNVKATGHVAKLIRDLSLGNAS